MKKLLGVALLATISTMALTGCSGDSYDKPEEVKKDGPSQFEAGGQAGADTTGGTAKQTDSTASDN